MADVLAQIDELEKAAMADLAAAEGAAALEDYRIKYLGSKGEIKALMKLLGQVPKDQKPYGRITL